MNHRALTAPEAFDDCLSFFEQALEPSMKRNSRGFSGDLDPGSEFEITLTITHGALTALVKRYPVADFEFHSERNLIPGVSNRENIHPLTDLYAEVTLDFTPYGTVFGGSSNDNGGGMTEADSGDETETVESGVTVTGPSPGPDAPSGPALGENSTRSPATA